MICKFCGNEIDDGSDFCYICGQKVEAPAFANAAESGSVYAAPEAEAALVVQAAAAPVQPQAEAVPEQTAENGKKPEKAGKAARFFSFLFALIGLILYRKELKKGNKERAVSILNALMRGLCVKMAIVVIYLGKKYMF